MLLVGISKWNLASFIGSFHSFCLLPVYTLKLVKESVITEANSIRTQIASEDKFSAVDRGGSCLLLSLVFPTWKLRNRRFNTHCLGAPILKSYHQLYNKVFCNCELNVKEFALRMNERASFIFSWAIAQFLLELYKLFRLTHSDVQK